ncbi:hypothetical protein DZC73_22070 [Albitalea terrae]|uniref:DUF4142 domain-containing protein n=2 Tax=Piscinibacter terrae TaxID=2496871 RepID=A0A3N7HJV3_9BURK|nr:hypothetical protein DZC73_22070 [Albitalea terrae]
MTAIAAVTALVGFSAHATEATQWDPQSAGTTASSEATTATHTAWATDLGEATQFHDAITRDSVASRHQVKEELKTARAHGLLNDSGEGGASDRVLAQREAFVHEEHDRLVALNTPAPDEDKIGEMIAAMTPTDEWFSDSIYEAYVPDSAERLSMATDSQDFVYRLPTDQQDPDRRPMIDQMVALRD